METQCYICYESETPTNLYAHNTCMCKGSLKIHQTCLDTLLDTHTTCKICNTDYITKPLIKHTHYPNGVLESSSAYLRDGKRYILQYDTEGRPTYVRRPFNAYEYEVVLLNADESIYSIHYYTTNTDKTVTRIPIDPEHYEYHWNNTICQDILAIFEEGI